MQTLPRECLLGDCAQTGSNSDLYPYLLSHTSSPPLCHSSSMHRALLLSVSSDESMGIIEGCNSEQGAAELT